jgi:branched-chain amino acid transport system permease protein
LALVLVFAVTRVIFIPQGEFVAYGALTLAAFQAGKTPGTLWLLLGAGVLVALIDTVIAVRAGAPGRLKRIALGSGPASRGGRLVLGLQPATLPLAAQVALALAIVVPLGPMIYRLAYQPLAEASVLVLLIVSVAVHLALVGLGLLFFGAEGSRTTPFSEAQFELGTLTVNGQTLWVLGASCVLIVACTCSSAAPCTARPAGHRHQPGRCAPDGHLHQLAGKLSFTLAAGIGALSGMLIAPITTVYYDTGFLVGLKGFVAAIIGGLASYPLAAAGAILVGLLESFSSFWASAFKEVIVFTLIIPVLLWRSLTSRHVEEEE